MKLVLLGTGGYYPTSERHTACLMLPEIGVVLDAGSGMCRLGEHLETDRLDIFPVARPSRSRPRFDVPDQRRAARCTFAKRPFMARPTKLDAIREHLFDETIFPVEPRFNSRPSSESYQLAGWRRAEPFPAWSIRAARSASGSIGRAASLAYVTDTTARLDADYVEKIAGVDLLVHECYFADNDRDLPAITGHSWLLPVAEVAANAKVGRLVLVHIGPHYDGNDVFDLAAARADFQKHRAGCRSSGTGTLKPSTSRLLVLLLRPAVRLVNSRRPLCGHFDGCTANGP